MNITSPPFNDPSASDGLDNMTITLIGLCLTSLLNLVVSIHSSIKARHFASECCGNSCEYDSQHHEKDNHSPRKLSI
jgi:hypothetical protein